MWSCIDKSPSAQEGEGERHRERERDRERQSEREFSSQSRDVGIVVQYLLCTHDDSSDKSSDSTKP